MLDFRIETFLTVCRTMNFTTAAKQLNITQPAVSQHIHFLEEEYGTSLFIYQIGVCETPKYISFCEEFI